jgi:hypothetical protein
MVAFLHTKHHVTFRACAVILICLGFIFSSIAGTALGNVEIPRTLRTVFAKLDIKDTFTIHPICFQCHVVFEPDIEPDTFCPDCEEEIFGAPPRDGPNAEGDDESVAGDAGAATDKPRKRKPYAVAPIQLLSTGLRTFFERPGMESAVNSWKTRPHVDGELKSIQDGEVWKTLKDSEGRSFFFDPRADNELRLGVSFSLDWYVWEHNYLRHSIHVS